MPYGRRALTALLIVASCALPAAADAAGPRAGYVTTVNGDSISTFDAFTGIPGGPLALSGHLWGVAITPDGATAYVANESTDSVIPIDTATNALGTPIPVGSGPRLIGITPDGATAYVANRLSNTVTPIDIASSTPGPPVAVGSGPHGIAISPDGSRVYVANIFSGNVSVIDTAAQAVVATVPAGNLPYTLAITPDGSTVYVTNVGSPNVWAIDTASNTTGLPIPIGTPTYGVAVAPDGDSAYVSASDAGWVVPIDTTTDVAQPPIAIGALPEGLAITPDGSTAYVTDIGTDGMWSLNLASGTYTLSTPTGQDPTVIAIAPDRSPTAAFDATVDAATATLDASAASDPDGTIASYVWDFGDGQTATGTQPTVSHSYAQPGSYTVTLTVTDDEGCSEALAFTGQTASCTGSAGARVTHTVTVGDPSGAPSPTLSGSTPALQSIERFALDGKCVRRARDGRARIGLRLRLAVPGSVAIRVDRAVAAKSGRSCPKPRSDRRYSGRLRRVATIDNAATQPVVASVRRRLTRHVELRPGLYRIAVRAYAADGQLTRSAYRWVRVLADRG
jgi:YVTN family beta-propeller protein